MYVLDSLHGWTHRKPLTGGGASYFIHDDEHMIPRNDVLRPDFTNTTRYLQLANLKVILNHRLQ